MPLSRSMSAVFAAILAATSVPTGLAAAEVSVTQRVINTHLALYPGGTQISPTEVSYAGGSFVVTFTKAVNATSGPDCPSGWFCFYDWPYFGYPRGKLSSCGWQDLSKYGWHDRTESVHTAQSYGTVVFLNHGSIPSHSSDVPLFSISPHAPVIEDVWPLHNIADHVKRYC